MTMVEVRERMVQLLGHAQQLSFINARLVLRTGISLSNIDGNHTPDEVERVVAALKDMGYAVDSRQENIR